MKFSKILYTLTLVVALVSYPTGLYFVSAEEWQQFHKEREEHTLKLKEQKRQMKCLREALWFEARGEPEIGIRAVAAVIKNRVESKKYPSTYCNVIKQYKQFSYVHERKAQGLDFKILPGKTEQNALVLIDKIVKEVQNKTFIAPVPKHVLWYHALRVKPKWAGKKKTAMIAGKHVFKHM